MTFDGTPKNITPDIRFTTKENSVYVFARSIKEKKITIKSITETDKIKKIIVLGDAQKVNWELSKNGLEIEMLTTDKLKLPIYVFKIEFKN